MSRYINPTPQYLDSAGNPVAGGKVYFYLTTTTTAKDTFSDEAESTANANPVILDAGGRAPAIWYTGVARVILKTSADVQIWDRDPVGSTVPASAMGAYNSGTTYAVDDQVLATDGNFYISISATNLNNEPSATPTKWSELATIRVWNTNETYDDLEVCRGPDGNLYRSTTGSNLGNNPTTDMQNWLSAIDDGRILDDLNGTLSSGGSSNAYTLTPNRYTPAYVNGQMFRFRANHTNTGACTLNVAGLGAKTLSNVGGVALVDSNMVLGRYYTAVYDTSYFMLLADLTPNQFSQSPAAYINFTLDGTANPVVAQSLNCTVGMDASSGYITVTLSPAIPLANCFIEHGGVWTGASTWGIPVNTTFRQTSTSTIAGGAFVIDGNLPTVDKTTVDCWVKVYNYPA